MEKYEFTNNWFENSKNIWEDLIPQVMPQKMLEIGSYEGASACYLIEKLANIQDIELHCIDTWEGGIEHQDNGSAKTNMHEVEQRFSKNIDIAKSKCAKNAEITIHKGYSDLKLSSLIHNGKSNYFDLIYIDGSHQAPDVLTDAVLAFKLLSVGGLLIFDDYLWSEPLPGGKDPIRSPKIAIDSFVNINIRKMNIYPALNHQLYLQKISD